MGPANQIAPPVAAAEKSRVSSYARFLERSVGVPGVEAMIYGLASLAWQSDSGDVIWTALWYLAACAIVAWLAHGKGRHTSAFFAISLLFTPVVGLLAVIAAHDLKAAAEAREADETIKHMLATMTLNMDGIRGHLAVSKEPARPSPDPNRAPQVAP